MQDGAIHTALLVGGSRGIGAAYGRHIAARVPELFSVSRSKSVVGRWIAADVSTEDGISAVKAALGERALDALLFLGGVWEAGAFTEAYDFERSDSRETRFVLDVNLVAPILLTQALLPNLRRAPNPRVVLLGALSGLDNSATQEVANSASKYGLRGAAQALDVALRSHGIGVTVVNPGNIATPEVMDDIASGRFDDQVPIPMADLALALDCALAMSSASVIREINIAQRRPSD